MNQEIKSLIANLAAVVRVQNWNKHDDINCLLEHADKVLADDSPVPLDGEREMFDVWFSKAVNTPYDEFKRAPAIGCDAQPVNARKVRDDALEEAATVCDELANGDIHFLEIRGYECSSAAIRALKSKPAEPLSNID